MQVFSFLGDRRAGDLGRAVHAGSRAADRPAPAPAAGTRAPLDWLARFRVEPARAARRGRRPRRRALRGAPAVALALSRLPLTAWFALPALLLPSASVGPVDDESGAAPPRASWRAGADPGAAARRRLRGRRPAGTLPAGRPPRSSEARPRPPSTGSSATSTPTARGYTCTTPATDTASPATTSSATPA